MKRLLDLFCGAGGAAMGYYQAGFDEIVGIDIKPQLRYPFDFIQGDALNPPVDFNDFDLIHASPPCQKFSSARTINLDIEYPDLLTPCSEMLRAAQRPFVIENVMRAPIRCSVMLCGTMFGLKLLRHRKFEISPNILILTPLCKHEGTVTNGDYACVVSGGGGGMLAFTYSRKEQCAKAMGIDWMSRKEMTQAIPPVYTEFIGKEILRHVA